MKKLFFLILSLGLLNGGIAFGQISGISNNVSCNGGADGNISITNTGNLVAPITYTFSPINSPNSTGNLNNIPAGSYTVQATDANNATATTVINITEPTPLVISLDSTKNASCLGNWDGAIYSSAIGGTPIYSFSLSPGGGTQQNGTFQNLPALCYILNVTDFNGCTDTISACIAQPVGFIQTIDSTHQPDCGDSTGYIKVSITGGGTYTTIISPNMGTQVGTTFSGLAQGVYTITTTDSNTCSTATTVALTTNNTLSYNYLNASYPTCYNGNDATITTLVNGGTSPITYELVNTTYPTNTTGQFTGINSGFYTIKASDANGCIKNTSLNIFNPSPIAITVKQYAASCNGSNGAVKLNSNSNYGPSTYTIQPSATAVGTDSFTALSYGTYTVTVQDAIGCSNTQTFTMSKATAYAQNTQLLECNGDNDAELTVVTNANFNYFNPAVLQPGNMTTTNGIFSGLSGGTTYTIYLNNGNGCLDTLTSNVYEPPAFYIAIDSILLPSSPTANNAYLKMQPVSSASYRLVNSNWQQLNTTGIFNNVPAGIYTLKVKRFNCELDTIINLQHPNCTMSFTNIVTQSSSCAQNNGSIQIGVLNGTGQLSFTNNATTLSTNPALFSNLNTIAQSITVTDSLGCMIDTTITLSTSGSAPIIDSIHEQNLACFNVGTGSAQVFASGGSGSLSYSLNGSLQQNTTGIFNNLSIGTYTVQVKDDSLCQSATSTFSIQNAPNFNPTILSTPSTCNTNCDGKIELFSNSTFNYTPQIDSFKLGNIINTSGLFDTLCPSNYAVTIYYDNTCIKNVNANVAQSSFQIVGSNKTNPTCPILTNGSFSLNVVNGTPPYQYSLNGGAYQTAASFNNLVGGTYTVTVKDALNCGTASTIVSLNTATLIVNTTSYAPSCVPGCDGSITVNAQGGTPPYSYLNNPTGPISAQTGNTFTNFCAGIYTITVTDVNGCTGTSIINLPNPSTPIISNVVKTNVSCHGDSTGSIINFTATGGSGPLNYSITPSINATPFLPYNNLPAGNYTITVSDQNACFSNTIVSITQPPAININPSINATTLGNNTYGSICGLFGYTVQGKLPIQVFIYDSLNNLINTFQKNNLDSENLQSYGLGQFKIVATDSCGSDSIYAVVVANTITIDSIQVTNASCNGANNGAINIQSSGGLGTIIYNIVPSNASNISGSFSNLITSNYTVVATDANGCSAIFQAIVSEPASILINQVTTQDVLCHGDSSGSVNINASGGTGAYNYTLNSNNYSTNSLNNLPAGVYTITLADANSCMTNTSFTINEQLQILMQLVSDKNPGCNPSYNGEIEISALGGTGSKSYSIAPVAGQQINPGMFMNLPAGIYTITAIDSNNCSAQIIDTLQYTTPPTIIISNSRYESCIPGNDGYVTLSVEPTQNTYQFSIDSITWSGNGNGKFYGNLQKGDYTFYIRDTFSNCYSSLKDSIGFTNDLPIEDLTLSNPTCFGTPDASIKMSNSTYNYSLFPTAGVKRDSVTFTNLKAGTYNVIGSDAKGCTGTSAVLLINPDELLFKKLNQTTATNVHCYGTVAAEVYGGTPHYTYSISPNHGKQDSTGLFEGLCWTNYTVQAKDKNGCTVKQIVQIEMDQNSTGNIFDFFEIFPNPADDFITIRSKYLIEYRIKLYDLYGNLVYKEDVYDKIKQLPTSHLAQSMYILRLNSEVDLQEYKIIIRH